MPGRRRTHALVHRSQPKHHHNRARTGWTGAGCGMCSAEGGQGGNTCEAMMSRLRNDGSSSSSTSAGTDTDSQGTCVARLAFTSSSAYKAVRCDVRGMESLVQRSAMYCTATGVWLELLAPGGCGGPASTVRAGTIFCGACAWDGAGPTSGSARC